MSTRIAIDAMGGDDAPDAVVEGAIDAVSSSDGRIEVVLVGRPERIRSSRGSDLDELGIEVLEAADVIDMDESPAVAVKKKTNSSIHVGLGAHRAGQADAFVSAGNTGAVMAASLFILGRLPAVLRPTLISYYPTVKGRCIVLDVGANVDCKPEHLAQFAEMGSIFVERVLERSEPSVGLLNIGEEPGKGNDLSKEAHELLSATSSIRFLGNIEGRDVMWHGADVVVCDGFVGNIILKLGESIATVLPELIAQEVQRQQLGEQEQRVVARVVRGVGRAFDYEEYGGTPLLGIDGTVMVGHGGSTARAFRKLLEAAVQMVESNVKESISQALGNQAARVVS